MLWVPPLMAITVITIILLRLWQKRRNYDHWLFMMHKCGRIPFTEDTGTGWKETTCTVCDKMFLWYDEDDCICTRCGVHYWQIQNLPKK